MNNNEDLLGIVKSKQNTFSKGQRRIASFLLENYDKAVYLTAAKLGEQTGVSESTVVRFASELGYDGYPAFQNALEKLLKTRLTASQRMAVTSGRIVRSNKHILRNVLHSDAERISLTLEQNSEEVFDLVVEKIISANKIYVLGGRSAAHLAEFLGSNLNLMLGNVVFINSSSSTEVLEQIFRIKDGDVFIGISFPRYSTQTIKAIAYASAQNATTIAITDSNFSPIAEHAKHTLFAVSDMVSFVDSLVAPLSLINALLVAVSEREKEKLGSVLDKLETLWGEYHIYSNSEAAVKKS